MGKIDHPDYYNSHPSGVECIDIIRCYMCDIAMAFKYLWRAGLKEEEGMSNIEKEIEDCKKAIWYIQDHVKQLEAGLAIEKKIGEKKAEVKAKCRQCPKFDHIEKECNSKYCVKYESTYYMEDDGGE